MEKVLFLQGKFLEKIWGGDRLKKEFPYEFQENNIGEYWAVSGMKAHQSLILNGTYSGEKLNHVYKNHKELFGNEKKDDFPLLIKLIDANEDLSIQVHPDDQMARNVEHSVGKTESWYILNQNESSIVYGVNAKDKKEAIELIDKKDWKKLLHVEKCVKGDFFKVPSGMVHAIKKGTLTLEIQQASDITYRLYDYDRKDKDGNKRELHLKKSKNALKVLVQHKIHEDLSKKEEILFDNRYFVVRKINIKGKETFTQDKRYLMECVVGGEGELLIGEEKYPIKKGDFFILTKNTERFEFKGNLEIVESYSK